MASYILTELAVVSGVADRIQRTRSTRIAVDSINARGTVKARIAVTLVDIFTHTHTQANSKFRHAD